MAASRYRRTTLMLAACLPMFHLAAPPASAQKGLIAPGAKVEKLAGDFVFTEGPAVDRQGNIFFSDVRSSRIHKWSIAGELSTFRENSGAANGLYFASDGSLFACEGGNRQLTSISTDGQVTVLADRYDGKRLNSPNDLFIDTQGGVYFTDPRYGPMDGLEQGGFFVYYLSPGRGQLTRVIDDLVKPNGVKGTADGRTLYVADAGDRKTYVYTIQAPGKISPKKLFATQGSDGMTLDERGNLYLTSGAVNIYDPQGTKLADIDVPERPANVCFGGADGKTLFITARTSLYAIRMNLGGQ